MAYTHMGGANMASWVMEILRILLCVTSFKPWLTS